MRWECSGMNQISEPITEHERPSTAKVAWLFLVLQLFVYSLAVREWRCPFKIAVSTLFDFWAYQRKKRTAKTAEKNYTNCTFNWHFSLKKIRTANQARKQNQEEQGGPTFSSNFWEEIYHFLHMTLYLLLGLEALNCNYSKALFCARSF